MRWLLGAALIVFAATAVAEAQFWVAVGSYQDITYAQEALDRAKADLRESFNLTPVDVEGKHWYRVMSGPYLSRGVAELTIVEAQQVGFDGAWMLVTESDDVASSDGESGFDEYEAYGEYAEYESSYDYDSYSDDIDFDEPAGFETEPREKIEHTLVGEAPASYGLHRLRRTDD
jgi:hypothetical protein